MRQINKIIIHCSATKPSMDIGVDEIRRWHLQRGWDDVGYHFVIRRDGTIESGRDMETIGAHAAGHNRDSLGLCLVGGIDEAGNPDFNYTHDQIDSLEFALFGLTAQYKDAEVLGHRDLPGVTKACPCFDAGILWRGYHGRGK